MIKGCIFDLDGTLADTVESIARGVNEALVWAGYEPRPVEEYNFYAGDGMDMAVERALKKAGDEKLVHLKACIATARAVFAENPLYHVKPYEGILETLKILKERECKVAVLSNKPHLQAIEVVEAVFGRECFDSIQGQEEGIPRKPDPAGAIAIAGRWKVDPGECLYIGDTNTDMQTAKAAGMIKVGVTWGFRPRRELEENGADVIIDTPLELCAVQAAYSHK